MPETRRRTTPVEVDMLCPYCGQGRMRPSGLVRMTHPPQIQHRCAECNHREDYTDKRYPYIEHFPVNAPHTVKACPPPNEELGYCVHCQGSEGELPTYCPHEPMTQEQKGLVLNGKLDYIDGQWLAK